MTYNAVFIHCTSEHRDKLVQAEGNYCYSEECSMLPPFPTPELLKEHEKVIHGE